MEDEPAIEGVRSERVRPSKRINPENLAGRGIFNIPFFVTFTLDGSNFMYCVVISIEVSRHMDTSCVHLG